MSALTAPGQHPGERDKGQTEKSEAQGEGRNKTAGTVTASVEKSKELTKTRLDLAKEVS